MFHDLTPRPIRLPQYSGPFNGRQIDPAVFADNLLDRLPYRISLWLSRSRTALWDPEAFAGHFPGFQCSDEDKIVKGINDDESEKACLYPCDRVWNSRNLGYIAGMLPSIKLDFPSQMGSSICAQRWTGDGTFGYSRPKLVLKSSYTTTMQSIALRRSRKVIMGGLFLLHYLQSLSTAF
jgi:hypothetical protein